jgi:hypothetical protein
MGLSFLTPHAAARMQQRGIRPDELEDLLDFGTACHTHHRGVQILFWDKRTRRRAKRRDGRVYAVVGADGVVITVGHRYRRILRD